MTILTNVYAKHATDNNKNNDDNDNNKTNQQNRTSLIVVLYVFEHASLNFDIGIS